MIKDLVEQLPEADFDIASDDSQGQVEIIGWLYQYYNQEPKDVAFKKRNYAQSDIPAVTQLFTPDWIVKYLVQNSVGRLWINHLQAIGETRSARDLAQDFHWKYFMPEAEQPESVKIQIQINNIALKDLKPEDITIIDPSMGSGHILIYAFDVLMQIYSTQGYSQREAAKTILAHNLFGLDIDKRAFQLAYFAMMMKGRQYNRRILRSEVTPNVFDVPSIHWTQDDLDLLTTDSQLLDSLKTINSLFSSGDELGSLISVDANAIRLEDLKENVADNVTTGQLSLQSAHLSQLCYELDGVLKVLDLLTNQYQVGVTNPPYMGSGKMPSKLATFVKKHYPNSKSDLFAVFMERLRELTIDHGYYAMITQHQWMFLSSFESLRKQLSQQTFVNMAHLGTRAFEEIGGEVVQSVAFVMQKAYIDDYVGTYERLVDFDSQSKKEQAYLEAVLDPRLKYVYRANQANFEKIPGSPIAYWANKRDILNYLKMPTLSEVSLVRKGMFTGDNDKFVRNWSEVRFPSIHFGIDSPNATIRHGFVPLNKGGSYRKWYGNHNSIIRFDQEAYVQIQKNGGHRSPGLYFLPNLTWTKITSGGASFRYSPSGYINNDASMIIYSNEVVPLLDILAIVNTKVAQHYLSLLNEGLNYTAGDIARIPILTSHREDASKFVRNAMHLSQVDWNSTEQSWNFNCQSLVIHIAEHTLSLLRKIAHWCAHVPKMCQRIIRLFKRSVC